MNPIAVFSGEFKLKESDESYGDWMPRVEKLEEHLTNVARKWLQTRKQDGFYAYSTLIYGPDVHTKDFSAVGLAVLVYDVGRQPTKEELMRLYAKDLLFDFGEVNV